MSDDPSRKRLGRGLAALIGDIEQPKDDDTAAARPADRKVPIEFVRRNPKNPRRSFDTTELDELAESIRRHGIVQPVVVRPVGIDRYELIAGERRWRAAQRAGVSDIPVLVRDVDDRTAMELAIVENVQRSDLNAIEEALGYQQLIDEHSYTQNELGEIIGKSRSHVANSLRLLKLPDKVRELITAGELSAGHARAIASMSDPLAAAKAIVAGGLSVRDAERMAQREGDGAKQGSNSTSRAPETKDADTLALERHLADALGLNVAVNHKNRGGQLRIDYKSIDQLEHLCRLLGVSS